MRKLNQGQQGQENKELIFPVKDEELQIEEITVMYTPTHPRRYVCVCVCHGFSFQ